MPEEDKDKIARDAEKRGIERGKLIEKLDTICGDLIKISQNLADTAKTISALQERLAVLETKTLFICAGVSIVLSVLTSIISGFIIFFVTK